MLVKRLLRQSKTPIAVNASIPVKSVMLRPFTLIVPVYAAASAKDISPSFKVFIEALASNAALKIALGIFT